MKDTRTATRGKRGPRADALPATGDTAAEAREQEAFDQWQAVAAQWACCVAARVRELARLMGQVDNLCGHPDRRAESLMLKMVFDVDQVMRVMRAVYEAEDHVNGMLDADTVDVAPSLADAARTVALATFPKLVAGGKS